MYSEYVIWYDYFATDFSNRDGIVTRINYKGLNESMRAHLR